MLSQVQGLAAQTGVQVILPLTEEEAQIKYLIQTQVQMRA
jgi:hypothetical protein